ncbi:DUF4270 domain-containing protein [Flavobacterium agrisoli]|uniref:DUF4270 domain-containing protein n=1 Tax=Flavobacterium agrisoli TaxID=2793066 RepID=A0A934UJJ4_9FLAO|nr:DUF4270 domain-containing protein [Flavobacterium agrisoli]MBK0369480.1 DUF4270 domain-containing protein [Flavobacterium agrisoli]
MLNTSFFKKIAFAASVILFCSCDKDYNVVGSDIIGDNDFDFEIYSSNLLAYNEKVPAVASNNLASNSLGIYDDPAFGTQTANFVTQVQLSSYAPVIGENPEIESVVLTIPYFSHVTTVNEDGSSQYALDSISGAADGKLKLSVYESGYYLRNLDPSSDFQNQQLYYTDQNATIDSQKKGTRLNDSEDKTENDEFFFDKSQIVIKTTDPETEKETTSYRAPEMQLNLNKDYFQSKILNTSASNLASADVFTNYFRGLYFKVEKSGSSPSNLALMNFAEGQITITYKAKTESTTDDDTETEEKTIVLNLKGNTISLLEESNSNTNYTTATTSANTTVGDERLYIRGGQGAMSIIDLFDKSDVLGYDENGNTTGPNGVSDELDDLRLRYKKNQLLINEANLIFYIDTDKMANSNEPNNIYLYDLTNDQALVDFLTPSLYGGYITTDTTTKKGISYKIRITEYIRNLIKNTDSQNVTLGLVVSESQAILGFNPLKTANSLISQVPKSSVMSARGTVLYGSTNNVPEDKKLKLQIYYTKPNN